MKKLMNLCAILVLFTLGSCSKNEEAFQSEEALSKTLKSSVQSGANTLASGKIVVGYVPSWKNVQSVIDNSNLNILTHLNIAFFSPNSSGQMMVNGNPTFSDANNTEINYVVSQGHQYGIKVLASFSGGKIPTGSGNLVTLLQSPNRSVLVNNIVSFLNFYNLDGIDVDIEGQTLVTVRDAGTYTLFIQELKTALQPLGKLVTCATLPYTSGMIPADSFPYFNYIHIMSYDNNWGQPGNHSSYSDALVHIKKFLDLNCPASKLTLGVPFYGYQGNVGTDSKAFKDIVALDTLAAYQDTYLGIKYNGIPSIKAKTRYAEQHIAGVMIWDLEKDAVGKFSLLKAIGEELAP